MKKTGIQTAGPAHEKKADQDVPLLIPGGLFIVIEGIDGTGKSTQVRLLADRLRKLGYQVVATREPTDGTYGRKIRQLFVDRTAVTPEEELALFLSDRAQHVREVILPALTNGLIVISDRYYLSTVAYQGANGMNPELILQKNARFPVPDLAVILEVEPEQGISRIQNQRYEHPNAFEEQINLQNAAEIFAGMQQNYISRINGSGSIEQVHEQVFAQVAPLLAQRISESEKS